MTMTLTSSALQPFGTTIFAEMSALATAHQAINLGQGFPDFGDLSRSKPPSRRCVMAPTSMLAAKGMAPWSRR